jgi:glycosyltransferase involved in cell wall biosynthesis
MRIGYDGRILASSQWTGIGHYTHKLIDSIGRLSSDSALSVFYPRGGTPGGIPLENTRAVLSLIPGDLREDRFLKLWYDFYLPFQIGCRGIDLFHGTGFLIPRTRRARTIVTVYDLAHEKYPELASSCSPEFAGRVRQAVARADAVIAISRATRDDIVELFHAPEGKLKVIYGGVDERFTPLRDPEFLSSFRERLRFRSPYVFSLMPLHPRKNVPGLLKAFSIFKKKTDFPHSLILGGKEYGGRESLSAVETLGISDSFRFVGYVPGEDLPLYYNSADVFIFPSLYEGYGLPPLEAMACGTPVLASRAGSLPEVLGDAAIYFDPAEPEEMAHRLAELVGSEEEKAGLREKGIAQAAKYNWESCARATLELYRGL